jgi:NTP pyrophosphatase (non-canonical NTP hydrolase)
MLKNQMRFNGLAKLTEELGELQQVVGKMLNLNEDQDIYWDGTSMRTRLIEEMGDVLASITFVTGKLELTERDIHERRCLKLNLYRLWDSGKE